MSRSNAQSARMLRRVPMYVLLTVIALLFIGPV